MNNEEKILQILTKIDSDVSELKERTVKIETTQENVVLKRIQLLAEGHEIIQEQIKRLSVIDSMQDDISILKAAVRQLSNELEILKKAI